MRTARAAVAALLLAATGRPVLAQHGLMSLPLHDPAYVQLEGLARLGCPAARVSEYRPFLVEQVRAALARAAADARCDPRLVGVLRDRFGSASDTTGAASDRQREPSLSFGAAATARITALQEGELRPRWVDVQPPERGDPPVVGILRARLRWDGGERLFAVTEGYAQSHSQNDPLIRARTLRQTSGVIDFSDAYVTGSISRLVLSLGRARTAWLGTGEESIVLSAQGPPIDRIAASARWSRVEAQALIASLDEVRLDPATDDLATGQPQRVNRMLVGHALTVRVSDMFALSIGETAIVGRRGGGVDLAYVNPLMIFLVTENDAAREDDDDLNNIAVFGAARANLGRATLRGELLVDDIQIDSRDRAVVPHQLAWSAEASYGLPLVWPASVRVEYERAGSYTYLKRPYSAVFQHYDAPLGSELGPDADRIRVGGDLWPLSRLRITGTVGRWRRGALRIYERPSPSPIGHAGEPFPTVTTERPQVQRSWVAGIGGNWLSPSFPIAVHVEAARVTNAGNQLAEPRLFLRSHVIGTYAFRYP